MYISTFSSTLFRYKWTNLSLIEQYYSINLFKLTFFLDWITFLIRIEFIIYYSFTWILGHEFINFNCILYTLFLIYPHPHLFFISPPTQYFYPLSPPNRVKHAEFTPLYKDLLTCEGRSCQGVQGQHRSAYHRYRWRDRT